MSRIGILRVAALFLVTCGSVSAFGVCNPACEPDGSSHDYSNTAALRPLLSNARGATPLAPKSTPRGGAGSTVIGSSSYNYAVPIVHLPGRAGLDLDLTLYYNSRVWTIDAPNSTVTFDIDRDFPSYGFRLGYGFLETTTAPITLTDPDGTKHPITNGKSTDTTYISYSTNGTNSVITYKNGRRITYEKFPGQTALWRPIIVEDPNGNFISVSYSTATIVPLVCSPQVTPCPSTAISPLAINQIIDTVGRTIQFNYDGHGQLTSITQVDANNNTIATYATFGWTTFALNYNWGWTVNAPVASGTGLVGLLSCIYPNGTYYLFNYGDWGIVDEIDNVSKTGTTRSYVKYPYQSATGTALLDYPTYTTSVVSDGTITSTTNYAVTMSGHNVSSSQMTTQDGTQTTTNLSTSGSSLGQISSDVIKDSTGKTVLSHSYSWTSDSGGNNQRVASVTTTNDANLQSKVTYTYDSYGNPTNIAEYDWTPTCGFCNPPGFKRQQVITYTYYTAQNILNLPTQVLVEDANNNIVARTDLAYDGTSLVAEPPPSKQHDDTYYGTGFTARGNLTQVKRYSDAAHGGGAITTTRNYDTQGNLLSQALDSNAPVQYAFSSATWYSYPDSITRGSGNATITTTYTYNLSSGTVAKMTDANQQVTSYSYDTSNRMTQISLPNSANINTQYDDQAAAPSVTASNNVNTRTTTSTTNGLGAVTQEQVLDGTNTVSIVTTVYDVLGRPSQVSNPYTGSAVYTQTQYDALGRPTLVSPPSGGSYQYSYSGNVTTIQDPAGNQRKTYSDALGRVFQVDEPGWGDGTPGAGSATITGQWLGGTGVISVTVGDFTSSTTYTLGSNPTSIASQIAKGFSNASSPVNASYSGGTVSLTSKSANASGDLFLSASATGTNFSVSTSGPALTGATDPTNPSGTPSLATPMSTYYFYDVLDDLLQVQQAPQQRIYAYDSLGRVTSVTPAEAGATTYTYTDFGSVVTRTDPRQVVATFTYNDPLNRLTGITYSDGTPSASYGYDNGTYGRGRPTSASLGSESETYVYDQMGNLKQDNKTIDGNAYNIGYNYDGMGNLTSITYPSGRVVTQGLDSIGRLSSISTGGTTLISGLSYNAAGQVLSDVFGNGIQGAFSYNDHMQLGSLRYYKSGAQNDLLNLNYSYLTGSNNQVNNGQIAEIDYYTSPGVQDNTKSIKYTYDAWERLAQAGTLDTSQWQLTFYYDRFGNRRQQKGTGGGHNPPDVNFAIDSTKNRIQDTYATYDAAGNMTQDDTSSTLNKFAYDAESRMITTNGGHLNTGADYTYDASGLRIKKVVGSGATTTIYIYSGAKVIAEYMGGNTAANPTIEYVYSGSQMLASIMGASVSYKVYDHLSLRAEADGTGVLTTAYGHFPFGEDWYGGTASKWRFTTYERDWEIAGNSVTDYAMARHYEARLGRFVQVDPLGGSIEDPQSLNRYAYVTGDPIDLVDPSGEGDECQAYGICTLASTDKGGGAGGGPFGTQCYFDGVLDPGCNGLAFVGGGTYYAPLGSDAPAFGSKGFVPYPVIRMDAAGNIQIWQVHGSTASPDGSTIYTGNGHYVTVPYAATTTVIGSYQPSVFTCLGQAAISAGEDLLGVSMLPGSDQDNWRWSSSRFGFVYTGEGEDLSPAVGLDVVEKTADFVKGVPAAKKAIRKFLKSEGVKVSLEGITKDAATVGKWAGRAGKILAAYSAYQRYQKCRGD